MKLGLIPRLRQQIPLPLIRRLRYWPVYFSTARAAFEKAAREPRWLQLRDLEAYHRRYKPVTGYTYSAAALAQRGAVRAHRILNWLPMQSVVTTLELGCWDGMTSCVLQQRGKSTVAIDNRSAGFDDRARQAGVKLIEMDVHHLQFDDESFDLVFSYNSFEHFDRPDQVLRESTRVLKPGGYLYLEFGPLYYSALGAHLYRQITVPYCHLLFDSDTLQQFAVEQGLGALDFSVVNGYSVQAFRALWADYSSQLEPVRYYELPNARHLNLIQRHPTCFKSKTANFDDLLIATIIGLFQKVGASG